MATTDSAVGHDKTPLSAQQRINRHGAQGRTNRPK